MKEGFLQERGISYRTNTFEPGRTTLLFIHGLSGSSSAWAPYEEHFEPHYNVITFDLRGHGLSKRYSKFKDYDISKFSNDTIQLLEHLNIEQCVIISHSLGALVALELLHDYHEKFSKAVFLAPASEVHRLRLVHFFVHLRNPLRALALLVALFATLFKKPGGRTDYTNHRNSGDWSLRRVFADVSHTGIRAYTYALNNLYAFKHEEWWSGITVPTLLVHGARDTMVPVKNSKELVKKIPNATLTVIEDTNHMVVLNNAPEVIKEIEGFIG